MDDKCVSRKHFTKKMRTLPVQIQIPLPNSPLSGFATGVFLSESNKLFLVTAAHCLFDNSNMTNCNTLIGPTALLTSYTSDFETNILRVDLKTLQSEGRVKRHASHDVAVIMIGEMEDLGTNGFRIPFPEEVFSLTGQWQHMNSFNVEYNCTTFTNLNEGDESFILGYPRELFNQQIPDEIDFESPLIRKGIISQINSKK
jgi:hypothetical protein